MLTVKTLEWRQWHRFGVFIVNFEHISHLFPNVSIVDFEEVNVCQSTPDMHLLYSWLICIPFSIFLQNMRKYVLDVMFLWHGSTLGTGLFLELGICRATVFLCQHWLYCVILFHINIKWTFISKALTTLGEQIFHCLIRKSTIFYMRNRLKNLVLSKMLRSACFNISEVSFTSVAGYLFSTLVKMFFPQLFSSAFFCHIFIHR